MKGGHVASAADKSRLPLSPGSVPCLVQGTLANLANAQAPPLFVAFNYPAKGKTSVTVPVTVMETEALLGFHEAPSRVQTD